MSKLFAISLLISACISVARAEEFNWLLTDASNEDLVRAGVFASRNERIVAVQTPQASSVGMAVPVTATHLLTAAHVLTGEQVGDPVRVGRSTGWPMNKQIAWEPGIVSWVDVATDRAVISLTEKSIPANEIPPVCPNTPRRGAVLFVYRMEPLADMSQLRIASTFSGLATVLDTMPRVRPNPAGTLWPWQIPHEKMAGQPRFIMARSAQGGASGGGVFDLERKCLVAIASATIPADDFIDPTVLDGVNAPSGGSFLMGLPISYFPGDITK